MLSSLAMASDVYTHGHHESVLRSHTWRTAENSAAYLLPSLKPGMRLLDVGCGPGTLTVDLAKIVGPENCVAIDRAADVLTQAREYGRKKGAEIDWRTGDVYALPFADASFDVVHAHQLLQHLTDPVAALAELGRVLRPGGVLAARDSDYACFSWAPLDPRLDRWLALYHQVCRQNRAEPDAGRFLKGWALAGGFSDVRASSSTWTFADSDACAWWGGLWADRLTQSSFGQQAVAYGLSTAEELAELAAAFRRWAAAPDAFFAILHGEILAR